MMKKAIRNDIHEFWREDTATLVVAEESASPFS